MSVEVPNSFIEQYEAEVKQAYQRDGSILRGTVRTRNQVGAERIYFPKLGKGKANKKARHADVTPMGLEHGRAFADMADYYAPEYIDDLDQAKVNWSIAAEYAKASGMAIGRQVDDILLDAIGQGTLTGDPTAIDANASGALTKKVILGVSSEQNKLDVPRDMGRYAVISPDTLEELLDITEATSNEFASRQLLENGKEPPQWMGYKWIMHTGLPAGVKGVFYHEQAVGHGISQDVTTKFDWIGQKVAWLANSYMSMGATIIENDGVFILNDS